MTHPLQALQSAFQCEARAAEMQEKLIETEEHVIMFYLMTQVDQKPTQAWNFQPTGLQIIDSDSNRSSVDVIQPCSCCLDHKFDPSVVLPVFTCLFALGVSLCCAFLCSRVNDRKKSQSVSMFDKEAATMEELYGGLEAICQRMERLLTQVTVTATSHARGGDKRQSDAV